MCGRNAQSRSGALPQHGLKRVAYGTDQQQSRLVSAKPGVSVSEQHDIVANSPAAHHLSQAERPSRLSGMPGFSSSSADHICPGSNAEGRGE